MKIGKIVRITLKAERGKASKLWIDTNDGEYVFSGRYEEVSKYRRGMEVCFETGGNRLAYRMEILVPESELIKWFHELKQQASMLKALGEPTPELDRQVRQFSEDYFKYER